MIPLSVPNLKGNELKYVTDAIEKEWVSTGGGYINQFEADIAKYLKKDQVVAVQSGTAGLHLALQLAGVEYGEEVIVPTLTFIAAVNPVRYLGAEPVFMDCDDTLCLDTEKLQEFCEKECTLTAEGLVNNQTNKRIKALVVVHVFGNLANMEAVMEITEKYQLKVIEDSTEALGTYYTSGKYEGKHAGTIGDFGVYSFNGNKIITTGGGGMMVAKDSEMAEQARYLSTQAKDDTLNFIHHEVGYNYRMTNVQAAIGVAQLEQLEDFIQTKKDNYSTYKKEIEGVEGLSVLDFNHDIRPNYWFYSVVVESSKYGFTREEVIQKLSEQQIQTRPIWGLIHQQKPYVNNQAYKIEKAVYYRDRIVNVPCSTNLTHEEVLTVTKQLKNYQS